MQQLKKMEEWIVKKSEIIEKTMQTDTEVIRIEEEPDRYMIQSCATDTNERVWAEKIGELFEYCERNGIKSAYSIGYRQNTKEIQSGIFDSLTMSEEEEYLTRIVFEIQSSKSGK